ncbi:QueT transporter family protein [Clostridium sp. D2Q-11]|uniref:QueT transporter family protein n=1 Tax=Anaeromonas frigoriresistens TaxID=2683708 RepID=A0A942Z7G4_9FIRM|nr:QueT transporter family protein [Anaeromonas frigoriresistens]MBS4539541.1 QueT transporter family protein [Anaeromonas frigoriresistens]
MKKFNAKIIAKIGIVAAIYVVLTVAFPLLSYGQVQFRVSEMLTLLAFFNPIYIWAVTIGTFFANMASTLGPIDIIVGTIATFLAVYPMTKVKNIWIASLFPAIANGIIIGLQLNILFGLPLIPSMAYVAFGELVVVTLIGVPVMKALKKIINF